MNSNVNSSLLTGSIKDNNRCLSSTIDLLRFPLVIMVIFIHMNPVVTNLSQSDFFQITGRDFYNAMAIMISHVLAHVAVPTFYFISGFLFFYNFQSWSWVGYTKKIQRRIKSLFIPYILWNLFPFLLWSIIEYGSFFLTGKPVSDAFLLIKEKSWHIFYDCNAWGNTRINWLGDNLRMTGPYNLPLWYLRDLIVVTLFSPIIYYAVKKLKMISLLFLFIAYISRIWIAISGFGITAFFFFTFGAYFALNKIDVVLFVKKYRYVLIPASMIFLIATIIFDGMNTIIGQNIYPFFICVTVFIVFYMASSCILKSGIKPNRRLASSCFFIYALHLAPIPKIIDILSLSQNVCHIIIPGSSGIENGICYLASPFIAAFVCILILDTTKYIAPNIALLFSGYR